jgi:hypothetical protein
MITGCGVRSAGLAGSARFSQRAAISALSNARGKAKSLPAQPHMLRLRVLWDRPLACHVLCNIGACALPIPVLVAFVRGDPSPW